MASSPGAVLVAGDVAGYRSHSGHGPASMKMDRRTSANLLKDPESAARPRNLQESFLPAWVSAADPSAPRGLPVQTAAVRLRFRHGALAATAYVDAIKQARSFQRSDLIAEFAEIPRSTFVIRARSAPAAALRT